MGVHDLLSASHPDTVPGTPSKGDLVVGQGGSVWNRLPIGNQADVLFTAGGAPGWGSLSLLAPGIDHGLLSGLEDDDHPRYPDRNNPEVIGGAWTWENFIQHNVSGAPSANPAEDHLKIALITDGANIVLRGYGPTGETCDICVVANIAVAHTNTLAQNWIE